MAIASVTQKEKNKKCENCTHKWHTEHPDTVLQILLTYLLSLHHETQKMSCITLRASPCWPLNGCWLLLLCIYSFLADRTIGRAYGTVCRLSSVCLPVICDVLYCGKTVRRSQKVSEGMNRKPGSKSSFFGSPPYFYFRFRCYSHPDGRFCLILAHTAQQSILDGRNWLSSSNPCTYGRILR